MDTFLIAEDSASIMGKIVFINQGNKRERDRLTEIEGGGDFRVNITLKLTWIHKAFGRHINFDRPSAATRVHISAEKVTVGCLIFK